MLKHNQEPVIPAYKWVILGLFGMILSGLLLFGLPPGGNSLRAQTISLDNPWENMGNDIRQVCAGGSAATDYEWGITYNNASPILRVTCNSWNSGQRVCTYPPYPTGDAEPFTWGGACWIWGTSSSWDDACSGSSGAYHAYYYEDAMGKFYMSPGGGCSASLPYVYRRKL